jgi:hypothetical protein
LVISKFYRQVNKPNIYGSVLEFLEEIDTDLRSKMRKCKTNVVYTTDLLKKYNKTHLQLQDYEFNLITTKFVVSAFLKKPNLWTQRFDHNESGQFPILLDLQNDSEISLTVHKVTANTLSVRVRIF